MADRNHSSLLLRRTVETSQPATWYPTYAVEKRVLADLWIAINRRTFGQLHGVVKLQIERKVKPNGR